MRTEFCPVCAGEPVLLWNNGSYPRLLPGDKPGETVWSRIFRKLCPRCRTSFSLHPECLLKRQRYSLTVVAAWLWTFLMGAAVRDRGFLEQAQAKLPVHDGRSSWSDSLDQQRTRPGYQRLHHWCTLFCLRAKQFLDELGQSAIAAGEPPEYLGWKVAEKAHGLLLAWVRWEALARSRSSTLEVDREEAFRQLVRTLAKVPSHKARRVSQRRYPYDVIIC